MKRRLRSLSQLLLPLVALASADCTRPKEAWRHTKDGLFVIRIATPSGYSEDQIADSLGYWKDEKLKVEYVGVLSPGTAVPAALSGKVDVVGGHPNTLIKARLAGAKITAVVNGMVDDEKNPHIVYHVTKRSGLHTPESFLALATVSERIRSTGRSCPPSSNWKPYPRASWMW
jgi:ABC-type nitrate/sulfonate/bicarbonate transport system substrate-binding protein